MTHQPEWPAHTHKKADITSREGVVIDTVMAVLHPGPNSYTGEDIAEISCHGNPLIVQAIIESILSTGLAVPAVNGEFTLRAYRNGKMDLAQAEAVGALIDAKNFCGINMAKELLGGELSASIAFLRNQIELINADIEAALILEDIEPDVSLILDKASDVIFSLEKLIPEDIDSRIQFNGVNTAIAGLPNAGKSSLFNAILGYDRSIVHEEEGTTGDIIKEHIEIKGLDFIFYDTAGLRDVHSGPESIGVAKSRHIIKDADLLLYVIDSEKGLTREDNEWLMSGKKIIAVMNKIDLCKKTPELSSGIKAVNVSAKYSTGIGDLFDLMRSQYIKGTSLVFIERHRILIRKALGYLQSFKSALISGLSLDAAVLDIKEAISSLNSILGQETDEDILNDVFSRFCVGK